MTLLTKRGDLSPYGNDLCEYKFFYPLKDLMPLPQGLLGHALVSCTTSVKGVLIIYVRGREKSGGGLVTFVLLGRGGCNFLVPQRGGGM